MQSSTPISNIPNIQCGDGDVSQCPLNCLSIIVGKLELGETSKASHSGQLQFLSVDMHLESEHVETIKR
jgi:hypothetical protein